MITSVINPVALTTKANVYFDGRCISYSFITADNNKKSVGVISTASQSLSFNTAAAEIMECVSGSCEYKLNGSNTWHESKAGERFTIPANSSFEIRVAKEAYHYICHFE